MALYNNGNRLGNTPYCYGLGALASIYNGRGSAFNGRMPTSALRSARGLFGDQAGYPVGNLAPASWKLPQVAGAMSLRPLGTGTIAAGLIPTRPMSLDLTGSGDLDATGALVVSLLLALAGEGTLAASITGNLNMTADLTGSGDLDANLFGIAALAVDLLGQGDIDATVAAFGNMEIDLVVTGTGLTTGNVGDAVWQYLIGASEAQDLLAAAGAAGDPLLGTVEGSLTLRAALRILLAGMAGTSERTGSTITFTSPVDGSTVRITGSFDAENNRTGVILDGD